MLKATFARTFSTNLYPFFPVVAQDPRWNLTHPMAQWNLNSQWDPRGTVFTPWTSQGMVSYPSVPQSYHPEQIREHQFQQQRLMSEALRKEQVVNGTNGDKYSDYACSPSVSARGPYAPTWAPFFQAESGMGNTLNVPGMGNTLNVPDSGLSSHHTPLTRFQVIEILMNAKRENKLTFKEIADHVGRSEVWTTSALLGQHPFSEEEADKLIDVLRLNQKVAKQLKLILLEPPMRGALNGRVPVDPTIYQLYEFLQVYGTTVKALTHEKVGDGIMSAVNLEINMDKKKKQDGDYVQLTLTGEFEHFKKW